jgi:hypothetical protein
MTDPSDQNSLLLQLEDPSGDGSDEESDSEDADEGPAWEEFDEESDLEKEELDWEGLEEPEWEDWDE